MPIIVYFCNNNHLQYSEYVTYDKCSRLNIKHIPASPNSLWNGFIVKLDTDQMILSFGRFEVHPELCVALRLHVVGHVLAVYGYDYLQVASPSMGCVDGEVDRLVDDTACEVRYAHLKCKKEF